MSVSLEIVSSKKLYILFNHSHFNNAYIARTEMILFFPSVKNVSETDHFYAGKLQTFRLRFPLEFHVKSEMFSE